MNPNKPNQKTNKTTQEVFTDAVEDLDYFGQRIIEAAENILKFKKLGVPQTVERYEEKRQEAIESLDIALGAINHILKWAKEVD